jgi:transmembrane sensor
MDANERRGRATAEASFWWHQLATRMPAHVSEPDRQQFTQWLRESPLHVAEMLHIAHVHDTLERFKLWSELAAGDPPAAGNVIAFERPPPPRPTLTQRKKALAWAMAAAIALVAIAAGWWALQPPGQVVAADRAERREVMLNDGSIVKLEPETRLRVSLEDHERRITLERGRALFQVAKDRTRPFLVEIDNTLVRAVGTAFGVERKDGSIVVTVAEGKVAVVTHASPEARAMRNPPAHRAQEDLLTAGKQLTVQRSGTAEMVRDVDTARALAWTQGRLVFDSTPLAEVVREFNRYNHAQLRVEDADLARRPISGVFQASDLETLIAFIRAGAHVQVSEATEEEMLIAPAP